MDFFLLLGNTLPSEMWRSLTLTAVMKQPFGLGVKSLATNIHSLFLPPTNKTTQTSPLQAG